MKNKLIILIMAVPLILTFVVFSMTSYASIKTNVAVAGVEIEQEDFMTLDLADDNLLRLKTTVFPAGATNKSVKYECEKVNSLDNVSWLIKENGDIIFSGYGQVRVKVSTVDGNYKDSIIVFVTSSKLIDFIVVAPSSNVAIGDKINFTTKVYPSGIDVDSISWQSSDSSVISIDSLGRAQAKSAGSAVITATLASGESVLTRSVTVVVDKMNASSVALINGKENATAKTIKNEYLFNSVINLSTFEAASQEDFVFEYDESAVKNLFVTKSIQNNQLLIDGVVTFKQDYHGNTIVDLKYLETTLCSIEIEKAEYLSKEDCEFFGLNDFVKLGSRGYFSISHLEDENAYFEVESSNRDILQISQSSLNIMYNAKSSGSVQVTAHCYYGSEIKFSISKNVNVVKVYSTLSFAENSKDYYINAMDDLTIGNEYVSSGEITSSSYLPKLVGEGNNVDFSLITLSSSNESVAKIEDGKILVLSNGGVDITATNKYASQTNDEVFATLKLKCVLGVNVFTYEDLVVATESGKQVVIQSDIMLGKKVLTRNSSGNVLSDNASEILKSEVKYINTTADWTYYYNNGKEHPQVAYCIEFKNNVYGNGYSLCGEYITNIIDSTNKPYSCAVFDGPLDLVSLPNIASVKAQDNIVFLVRNSNITISNIELKGCDGESIDDLTKLDYIGTVLEIMGDNVSVVGCNILNGRNCVRVYGDYEDSNKVINVTFDRCVIRYAREFLLKMGTNMFVSGDISTATTLEEKFNLASPNLGGYNHIENNIQNEAFRNEFVKTYVNLIDSMLATSGIFAIGIESKFAGPCLDGENYNEWDFDEFGWVNIVGTSYASVLNLIGDVRIYDWKKVSDVDSSTLIEVSGSDTHGLVLDLSSIITDASSDSRYANLISKYNQEDYVHGGIVLYGGGKNYSVVSTSEYAGEEFREYRIGFDALLDASQRNILQLAAGKQPFRFMLYDENEFSVERQVYDFTTGEAFTYLVK